MCNIANLHAISLLRLNDLRKSLDWLRRCKELAECNPKCLAITYNNLACYYKKIGHHRTALIQLEKALELEDQQEDNSFKADTHLNVCAVLSGMGRHDLAMHHA